MNDRISVFIPASKSKNINAKVVKKGAICSSDAEDAHPKTEPNNIPISSSHTTSGIPVLSKISSPINPIKSIAARTKNTVSRIIGIHVKLRIYKHF